MALSYINSGNTINEGRLIVNANTDKIVTGATSSNGLINLNQYGGGSIAVNYGYFVNYLIGGLYISQSPSNPLHFTVTSGSYLLNGTQVNSSAQSVTCDAGHASLDRFDLLALDANGTASIIKGTASSVPATPSYNEDEYYIRTIIYVRAGAASGSTGGGVVVYGGGGSTTSNPVQPVNTGGTYSYHRMGTDENSTGNFSVIMGVGNGSNADFTAVVGGENNIIESGSSHSSIVGGKNNRIPANLSGVTILGGNGITADTSNTLFIPSISATTGLFSTDLTADTITLTTAGGTITGQNTLIVSSPIIARMGGIGSGSSSAYNEYSVSPDGYERIRGVIRGFDAYKFQTTVSADTSTSNTDRSNAGFINSFNSTIKQNSSYCNAIGDSGSTINTGTTNCNIIGSQSSSIASDKSFVNIIGANARTITAVYPDYLTATDNLLIGKNLITDGIYSAGASLTATTDYYIYLVKSTAGAITITLPVSPVDGQRFLIKDVEGNAAVNNVIINGNGYDIDSATEAVININNGFREVLYSDNAGKWVIIACDRLT